MLQIIDITGNILYQQQKTQNELLAMINVCVSHELRNPLNSISALNVEKRHLYELIEKYIRNEDFTKAVLVKNLKLAIQ
jgi:signal transduction histidine kinase